MIDGDVPVTSDMRAVLTPAELADGWRLGCLAEANGPVTLEIAQWSINVLDDRAVCRSSRPKAWARWSISAPPRWSPSLSIAQTGTVLKVETALNPQARFGADLMSRIRHDLAEPGALTALDPRHGRGDACPIGR